MFINKWQLALNSCQLLGEGFSWPREYAKLG